MSNCAEATGLRSVVVSIFRASPRISPAADQFDLFN